MLDPLRSLRRDESGRSLVEYVLFATALAFVVFVAMFLIQGWNWF